MVPASFEVWNGLILIGFRGIGVGIRIQYTLYNYTIIQLYIRVHYTEYDFVAKR